MAFSKAAPKLVVSERIMLRKWCIEQAIYWPTHGNRDGKYADEDVIGRAKKIYDWVTE